MATRARILIVDDEADNRRVYGDLLSAEGYAVRRAANAAAAFALAVESPPDLVLSDVSMPDEDGLSLLSRLRAEKKTANVPVILMSGVRTATNEQAEGLDQPAAFERLRQQARTRRCKLEDLALGMINIEQNNKRSFPNLQITKSPNPHYTVGL